MRKAVFPRAATLLLTLLLLLSGLYITAFSADLETGAADPAAGDLPAVFRDTPAVTSLIGTGSITIHLVDSVRGTGLPGVEFELSSLLGFTGQSQTATTDAGGKCTFSNLGLGLWYLRQNKTIIGYIPYLDIIPVSVGLGNVTLNLKSTPYGSIEIKTQDDLGNPVKGAVYSLYSGSSATGTPLQTGLTSDANGLISAENVTPGTYTLLETAAPSGYHISPTPQTFEVLAGEKKVVTVINSVIAQSTIHLYNRDATSDESLAGGVFGLYRDAAYTDEVTQVTALKDTPAVISNLAPGTYYAKQLTVPEGYLADAPAQTLVLLEGQLQEVTFYNTRSYPTAGNYGLALVCGLAGLALCGLLAVCLRRHA